MAFIPSAAPSTGHDNQADFRADMDVLNDETPQMGSDPVVDEETPPAPEGEEETPETPEGKEEGEEEVDPEAEPEPEGEEEPGGEINRIHSRPSVRDIKAQYPDFFKKFPDMRHMLFREGEYSKVFPTVDDAKEAQSAATDFSTFRDMLTDGSPEKFGEFLSGVKESGALTSMAANFLPSLFKADRDMYFSITTPIAESLLRNAYKNARTSGNENLANAALHLSQWAFGDQGFATGEKVSPELKPTEVAKDPKLEKDKKEFYQLKYTETQQYVNNTSRTKLMAEVRRGLDPSNAFNPTIQNLLVKQVMEEVGQVLQADERHMAMMNSLWKQAHRAGFAGEWKDRILSAYLSRARQVMPVVRAKIRADATKNERQENARLERVATRSADRREVSGSQNTQGRGSQGTNGRPPAARDIDWGKTSDLDILNDQPTLKQRK